MDRAFEVRTETPIRRSGSGLKTNCWQPGFRFHPVMPLKVFIEGMTQAGPVQARLVQAAMDIAERIALTS